MALSPGLGPKRILDAVQQIGAANRIFTMPLTALEGLRFPAAAAQFLYDGEGRRAAEEEWARVTAQGATLIELRLRGLSRAPARDLRSSAGACGCAAT